MTGRTIAIGDIHGCSDALEALIDVVKPTKEDTLVFLGDYIDRGPDSKRVINFLMDLLCKYRIVTIKGNHEEMFEGALQGGLSDKIHWTSNGGIATINSYTMKDIPLRDMFPPDHVSFIKSCVDFYETDTHIFVHACCDPKLPELKDNRWFTWRWQHLPAGLQQDDPRVKHVSGKTLIVGHTPQWTGKILDIGCLKCIDTWAVGETGCLTALEVHTNEIWQTRKK